jgi:hypothetical protein
VKQGYLSGLLLGLLIICLSGCFFSHHRDNENVANPASNNSFQRLAENIVESLMEFEPSRASLSGYPGLETKVEDYSNEAINEHLKQVMAYREKLAEWSREKLIRSDREDLEILKFWLNYQIWRFSEFRERERNILLYTHYPFLSLQMIAYNDTMDEATKRSQIVKKLDRLGPLMQQAVMNLKILDKHQLLFAIDTLTGAVSFMERKLPIMFTWSGFEKQSFIDSGKKAVAGARDFIDFLEKEFKYWEARDPRLEEGPYKNILQHSYLVDYSIDRLLEIGRDQAEQTNKEILELSLKIDSTKDPGTLLRDILLKRYDEFPTMNEIVKNYEQAIPEIRRFLSSKKVSIATIFKQDGDLAACNFKSDDTRELVQEAYKCLGEDSGSLTKLAILLRIPDQIPPNITAYQDFVERSQKDLLPSLDAFAPLQIKISSRISDGFQKLGGVMEYCVQQTADKSLLGYLLIYDIDLNMIGVEKEGLRKQFSRHGKERRLINLVNKGYPGEHFLQTYKIKYTSPVRRYLSSDIFSKGWAFYSEELMGEIGFFSDEIRLLSLFKRKALFDDMVNTIEYHAKRISQYEGERSASLDVSSLLPIQAVGQAIGYFEILQLRQAYEAAHGSNDKSIKAFHEQLLSYGATPFKLVKKFMFEDNEAE